MTSPSLSQAAASKRTPEDVLRARKIRDRRITSLEWMVQNEGYTVSEAAKMMDGIPDETILAMIEHENRAMEMIRGVFDPHALVSRFQDGG